MEESRGCEGAIMEVFVTGSTGVLGRRVVPRLVADGHRVTAVVRGPAGARQVTALGATPVQVDIFDRVALRGAIDGHDAVMNLATSIPGGGAAVRSRAWHTNHRIRREASRALTAAAAEVGVERFVQESITLLYGDGEDRWIDETSPLDATPITASALDAEASCARFADGGGRGIVLRFAAFYGPDSHHTLATLAAAAKGRAEWLGAADAYWSVVTTDDAATAAVAALDAPSGTYNVVDDEPLTRAGHFEALGRALGRDLRPPAPLADRVLRVALGRRFAMLFRSYRVSGERLRAVVGWSPASPSAREGWRAVTSQADVPADEAS